MARRSRLDRAAGYITEGVIESLPDDPRVTTYVDNRIDYRLSRTKSGISFRRHRDDD